MGGRGRGRYTATQPKGKGVGGGAPRGVVKEWTVHVDLLRAFLGEDGSILLHRQGTRNDGQVLEKECLIHLLTKDSHELLNRPAKGLSMLCGSMTHGLLALERFDTTMCQGDRRALISALQSLAKACTALDSTKKGGETTDELKTAIQQIFSYLTHSDAAAFQRLAVLGAQIYVTAMQLLEAEKQYTVVVGIGSIKNSCIRYGTKTRWNNIYVYAIYPYIDKDIRIYLRVYIWSKVCDVSRWS